MIPIYCSQIGGSKYNPLGFWRNFGKHPPVMIGFYREGEMPMNLLDLEPATTLHFCGGSSIFSAAGWLWSGQCSQLGPNDSGKTPTNTSPNRCHWGTREKRGEVSWCGRAHVNDEQIFGGRPGEGLKGLYLKVEWRIPSQSQFWRVWVLLHFRASALLSSGGILTNQMLCLIHSFITRNLVSAGGILLPDFSLAWVRNLGSSSSDPRRKLMLINKTSGYVAFKAV